MLGNWRRIQRMNDVTPRWPLCCGKENRFLKGHTIENQHLVCFRQKKGKMGRRLAQLVERASHVQWLCPRCSRLGLSPGLGPFAACHSPSLSSAIQMMKNIFFKKGKNVGTQLTKACKRTQHRSRITNFYFHQKNLKAQ